MKEMNQKGVSRGPAMSVKHILAASVFILVLASFWCREGEHQPM